MACTLLLGGTNSGIMAAEPPAGGFCRLGFVAVRGPFGEMSREVVDDACPVGRDKENARQAPASGLAHAGGSQAGGLGDRRVGGRERDHGQARPGGGAAAGSQSAAQDAGSPGCCSGRRPGGLRGVRRDHPPGLGRLPGRAGGIAGPSSLSEHRAQEHRTACEDATVIGAAGESARGGVAW